MRDLKILDIRRRKSNWENTLFKLGVYGVISISLIIFVFPIYWIFISSLKPIEAITNYPPSLIPSTITFETYVHLLTQTNFLTWLKNSLIVSIGDVVLTVTLSTFAGYALTRYTIPHRKWLARFLILGYMFPALTLAVPQFVIFEKVGLLNSLFGVILAHTAVIAPFCTWLMWQFFQTVPISMEESAWVYGASRTEAMIDIALPAAMPGIVAVAIFAFAIGWSDFTFAFILLSTPEQKVLTLGIIQFIGRQQTYWGNLMAANVGLILPPLVIVTLLNKYLLEGFSLRSDT